MEKAVDGIPIIFSMALAKVWAYGDVLQVLKIDVKEFPWQISGLQGAN